MSTDEEKDEHERYMEENRLCVLATVAVERAMTRAGLTRYGVAQRLRVNPLRVEKQLDGEENMTLQDLAAYGLACGVRWSITYSEVSG